MLVIDSSILLASISRDQIQHDSSLTLTCGVGPQTVESLHWMGMNKDTKQWNTFTKWKLGYCEVYKKPSFHKLNRTRDSRLLYPCGHLLDMAH